MAGGGYGRGAGIPLAQRRRVTTNDQPTPEPDPTGAAAQIKHCWVTDRHGRLPGLLLTWRQTPQGWEGRVIHPTPDPDSTQWALIDEWLPAGLLDPTT